MAEFEKPNQHENYLGILLEDIKKRTTTFVDLKEQLRAAENQLNALIRDYEQERHQRQEEIWRQRCLTRCTKCYDIPPGKTMGQRISTPWGGWGLMPEDDTHYVLMSDSPDYHRPYRIFHRLCGSCYEIELKAHAADGGRMRDLSKDEVEEINQILTLTKADTDYGRLNYRTHASLSKKWSLHTYTDIVVRWYNLHIPEEAYEIGQKIDFNNLLEELKQKK